MAFRTEFLTGDAPRQYSLNCVSHRGARRRALRRRLGARSAGDALRLPGPDLPAVQRRHQPALGERRLRGHEVLRVGAVADPDGHRARHGHEQLQRPQLAHPDAQRQALVHRERQLHPAEVGLRAGGRADPGRASRRSSSRPPPTTPPTIRPPDAIRTARSSAPTRWT